VQSPDISTDCLRKVSRDSESQLRRAHLELWRELPQLNQSLDLVSQHKLQALEIVITSPVAVVYWLSAKGINLHCSSTRQP